MAASSRRLKLWCWTLGVAAAIAVIIWRLTAGASGDPRLAQFVQHKPPVPVVFTSRSDPASLRAAAPPGEGLVFPGLGPWQAAQGRLRLLTPQGQVRELTWAVSLPDGGTLIDVMSPSVSIDGTKIVFAGRRGGNDHGRFRLYEIGVAGENLRPLTGGRDDVGCRAVPPMRYQRPEDAAWAQHLLGCSVLPAAYGAMPLGLLAHFVPATLREEERRRVDYDDIDPAPLSHDQLAFVSSRTPDLGRGHARRATNLWFRSPKGELRPFSSNRNNDRWPFYLAHGMVAFSHWSRNLEVIGADGKDIGPHVPGEPSLTGPTNNWMAGFVAPDGDRFGPLVKLNLPAWRPRPLFNGQVAFMTVLDDVAALSDADLPAKLRVVQVRPQAVNLAPSSTALGAALPTQAPLPLAFGPAVDRQGRKLALATPSPCPKDLVLMAGALAPVGSAAFDPKSFGLYLANDGWTAGPEGTDPAACDLRLLFDDPELVDAEPVAVYQRAVMPNAWKPTALQPAAKDHVPKPRFAHPLEGPAGKVQNGNIYQQGDPESPGQTTDAGQGPLFAAPPRHSIDHVRFYLSHRDRFDHPFWPRLLGPWEEIQRTRLEFEQDSFQAWLPAGIPSVLAGFSKDGTVVSWTSPARDSQGRQATFYAFAGDHYSGMNPRGYTFCVGCHPGHSGLTMDVYRRPEAEGKFR